MRGRNLCTQPPHLGGGFKNKSSSQHPIITVNALIGKKGGYDLKQGGITAKKKAGKSIAQKIIPLLRQINAKNSTGADFAKSSKS